LSLRTPVEFTLGVYELVKALGMGGILKSQVSRLCEELAAEV
jgi:hypothetical protein